MKNKINYYTEEELKDIQYRMSNVAVKILESYRVKKKFFKKVINRIETENPETKPFQKRTMFDMKMEWATHNFLYNINFQRNRTADVDLNCEINILKKIAYTIVGLLTWIFIK